MGPKRFVYYRVPHDGRARAEAAVRALHDELRARWPGLRCCLLRRADHASADHATLMEIYEGLPSPAALAEVEALALARLAPWLVGERHIEAFEPCA
ncbi:MAG: DUF4936 family protein [Aquincola sp.]|nr:DUF4936 family protein [Aquincola sp.]MDH4288187.1 DUF4936 family protein [Aquincola sp.]MDH5331164.1 DUF4936 family protein [Aquincola sp.]